MTSAPPASATDTSPNISNDRHSHISPAVIGVLVALAVLVVVLVPLSVWMYVRRRRNAQLLVKPEAELEAPAQVYPRTQLLPPTRKRRLRHHGAQGAQAATVESSSTTTDFLETDSNTHRNEDDSRRDGPMLVSIAQLQRAIMSVLPPQRVNEEPPPRYED